MKKYFSDSSKIIMILAYLYLMLPVGIFLAGWCRWYVWVPGILILAFCFIKMCKNLPQTWSPKWTLGDKEKVVFAVGAIMLWVYFSGVGALVAQNGDHLYRNTIYEMLVNHDWPVIGDAAVSGENTRRALVYYIGFWLPSAVFGKVFGMEAGYLFQFFWAALGISLFYYLLCMKRKSLSLWPLAVFIFFSGLDIVGYYISGSDMGLMNSTLHLEWWSQFQFSGITTQLFWVFNQAVPAWVCLMLIQIQKSNRCLVFLMGLLLLSSTLPFMGMVPFVIYFMFSRRYEGSRYLSRKWQKCFLKDTFTLENLLGGGFVGILTYLYLKCNFSGQRILINEVGKGTTKGFILIYVVFILLEAGVYWLAVYRFEKKNPLFYLVMVWLCICPLIKVGHAGDFCMRASIPALVLLCLMVIDALQSAFDGKNYLLLGSLILLLLIGSVTSVHEINRTVAMTTTAYTENKRIPENNVSEDVIFSADNFSGKADAGFFFRYLASD